MGNCPISRCDGRHGNGHYFASFDFQTLIQGILKSENQGLQHTLKSEKNGLEAYTLKLEFLNNFLCVPVKSGGMHYPGKFQTI